MPLDRARLSKLLALTTSDNDHEAIGCIRAANRMLAAEKLSWEEVLAGPVTNFTVTVTRRPDEPPQSDGAWSAPHLRDKVIIDLMFRTVYAQPRTDNDEFWQFMDSIHHRWEQHGNLTQSQYWALKRSYNRARKN
jgi:hypothetical protein